MTELTEESALASYAANMKIRVHSQRQKIATKIRAGPRYLLWGCQSTPGSSNSSKSSEDWVNLSLSENCVNCEPVEPVDADQWWAWDLMSNWKQMRCENMWVSEGVEAYRPDNTLPVWLVELQEAPWRRPVQSSRYCCCCQKDLIGQV